LEVFRVRRSVSWAVAIPVAAAAGIATALVHGYRLNVAPDVFSDEGIYLIVGKNLASGAGLVGDAGPFFWHPPLFMLAEAAFIKVSGIQGLDLLSMLFAVRELNVIFAGLTAALLVLMGRQLGGLRVGLLSAALFLLDPYVQRIDRRNMLETLAMLLVLVGLYLFIALRGRRWRGKRFRWLLAGVAFGLAALTKEAMVLQLVTLAGIAVWARREDARDGQRTIAVACAVYAIYPIWAFLSGNGQNYLAYKVFDLRLIGSGFTGQRPTSSGAITLASSPPSLLSADHLRSLLADYGTSYAVILLAVIGIAYLVTRFRHLLEARYVITFGIVNLVVDTFLARISDQYSYYLVVSSIVVVAFATFAQLEALTASPAVSPARFVSRGQPAMVRYGWASLFVVVGLAIATYDGQLWVTSYVDGSDNAYTSILSFTEENVPPGSAIVVTNESPQYLLPASYRYEFRFDYDPAVLQARHEHYFILSSKEASAGNHGLTRPFYDWLIRSSQPLLVAHDATFGTVGVYYRSDGAVP
jgi:hypothetical protein